MSIDGTLRLTWRHFVTEFLLVAVVTIPLFVGHAFVYRRVIGLRELHPAIEQLPANRQVRSVGGSDLAAAEGALVIVVLAALALLPLMVGATRRVLQQDASGRLPTVVDAWAHAVGSWRRPAPGGSVGGVVVGAALGALAGYLIWQTGLIVTEPVGETAAFAAVGVLRGAVGAAAAPFFLVPIALLTGKAKGEGPYSPTI